MVEAYIIKYSFSELSKLKIMALINLYLITVIISHFSMISSFRVDSLRGIKATQTKNQIDIEVDIGTIIDNLRGGSIIVFGTYAADFNMIEYCQRLRHYIPKLKDKGVANYLVVVNGSPFAANHLSKLLDLPNEINVLCDPNGTIGRAFGVSSGWKSEDKSMNPYIKLFGMLWGLGAYATLPAVIGGYLGNPWSPQPWIEEALAQGQVTGRWPDTALEIDKNSGRIIKNKFDDLPVVGAWQRRPLELATLRLQNMIGVSLKHWEQLQPSENELSNGVLTQLGGCLVLNDAGDTVYEWRDAGICHVANFEDILRKLEKST